MRKNSIVALAAVGFAGAFLQGCSNPAGPDTLVEPIQIDSVDVRILESSPPRAVAHVEGVVGDGCSELYSVNQTRSGNMATVTILRQRPKDAVCTQIAKLYNADIPLEGTFPAGRYVLMVNSFEKVFTTN
jgi:hypothetical protein